MISTSPAPADQRPVPSPALWSPPRVVHVAVTRPETTLGTTPMPAVEWQQRARADRRL